MVAQALNLGILTAMFFIIGMIKPKWPLFFMEKPSRFLILAISTILFMISATMYGEGHRQEKNEKVAKEVLANPQALAPVPLPEVKTTTTPAPQPKPAK